ncbi:hypothetical protein [Rufibacter sp. LB8]|uniref:hypothetical protein n=1 Tax=Rufibacter sp. LB8 TaxID=2777781 RepID=UPI00178C3C4C|nr:hypothetical protein [Rufibacter sp. LB8]
MRFLQVLSLLLLSFQAVAQDKVVLVKVNPIKGESTVTVLSNLAKVEEILQEGFVQKGYKVLTKAPVSEPTQGGNTELFLADAFIYQYPGDYPSITLTIRKDGRVHSLLHQTKKLFTDRQAAMETLAREIVKEIPATLNQEMFLMPELDNLLPHHIISIYTATSGAITGSYASKYTIEVKPTAGKLPAFMIAGAFEEYLSNCLDFNGYRKAVKDQPIQVEFEINSFGFTHIQTIKMPEGVKDNYKEKVKAAMEALPLWDMAAGQTFKGVLSLGVKK